LNDSVPKILDNVSVVSQLPGSQKQTGLENIEFKREGAEIKVTIPEEDREKFLQELSISENLIKKIKKRTKERADEYEEFKAARGYLKLSNKFFLDRAIDLVNKGHFKQLSVEIRKANIGILFEAYVAMIFFSVLLSFFFSIFLVVFLMFLDLNFIWPFVSFYEGSYLIRALQVGWLLFAVPVFVGVGLYAYPSLEKSSLGKKIDQELPFAVIHMGAIAGSGISPNELFKIIGMSKDYPNLRKELRKVLNLINLYGYDLVTALSNASKTSPSTKLAELFSGLATTIHSGGELKEYFEKRGETLLLGYRLEREKYSKVAETFMDIYISVIIAAPMILMLLLIMISVSGISVGFSQFQLTLFIILILALLNILFLGFLHIRQPTY